MEQQDTITKINQLEKTRKKLGISAVIALIIGIIVFYGFPFCTMMQIITPRTDMMECYFLGFAIAIYGTIISEAIIVIANIVCTIKIKKLLEASPNLKLTHKKKGLNIPLIIGLAVLFSMIALVVCQEVRGWTSIETFIAQCLASTILAVLIGLICRH